MLLATIQRRVRVCVSVCACACVCARSTNAKSTWSKCSCSTPEQSHDDEVISPEFNSREQNRHASIPILPFFSLPFHPSSSSLICPLFPFLPAPVTYLELSSITYTCHTPLSLPQVIPFVFSLPPFQKNLLIPQYLSVSVFSPPLCYFRQTDWHQH